MIKYFPVFINIENMKCLVIGGGKIAERKIKALSAYKAKITIISPKVTKAIGQMAKENKITLINRKYRRPDVNKARIIIAATGDKKLNTQISNEAKKIGALINSANNDGCNFIMPAVIKKGNLQIAVSTGGGYPFLSKKIKQKISGEFNENFIEYLDFLTEIRQNILKDVNPESRRKQILRKLISDKMLHFVRNNNKDIWVKKIREILKKE